MRITLLIFATIILLFSCSTKEKNVGKTEITKWQSGKRAAVSITYDDGSINQFRKALPIMDSLGIPATFFIITGQIPGSHKGKFIGRPVKQIIDETASTLTSERNFFERCAAAPYLNLKGTAEYGTRAGAQFDAGNNADAYRIMDELYNKVRKGDFEAEAKNPVDRNPREQITWDEIKIIAAHGHEFASHTVTHPYLCALDEPNIWYELRQSKEDILKQIGEKYTFSAEVPYGSEHERAMKYAHQVYPALRNRMPEPFLKELNRSSSENPGAFHSEYIQWQRGATTKTPLSLMKAWVDTAVAGNNMWLVLVIHGVDGIGWEALSSDSLAIYFKYIKSYNNDLWIATFGDAARYCRERMNAKISSDAGKNRITVSLIHSLDKKMYDLPLTLKTIIPENWNEILVKQGNKEMRMETHSDKEGRYVIYQAVPNADKIFISRM